MLSFEQHRVEKNQISTRKLTKLVTFQFKIKTQQSVCLMCEMVKIMKKIRGYIIRFFKIRFHFVTKNTTRILEHARYQLSIITSLPKQVFVLFKSENILFSS
jgi:hypothetical protein